MTSPSGSAGSIGIKLSLDGSDLETQLTSQVQSHITPALDDVRDSISGIAASMGEFDSSGLDDLSDASDTAASSLDEAGESAQQTATETSSMGSASRAAGGALQSLGDRLSSLPGPLGQVGSMVSNLGTKFAGIGSSASSATGIAGAAIAGLAAGVGVAAAAITKELYDIGSMFDDMSAQIQISTGAAGDQLAAMNRAAMQIGQDIPVSFEEAGAAVAELSRVSGATGSDLQELAERVTNVSRLTGGSAQKNAQDFARTLNQWQIDATEGAEATEDLFVVMQRSGLSFSELTRDLSTYGSILQNANFSMQDAAVLFGQLERSGLGVSRVMPGLNQAFREWADDGLNVRDMLSQTAQAIAEAETQEEALSIATEAFGAEGAQRLTTAIRGNIIDLDNLGNSLGNTEGAIESADAATRTFSDSWQTFKNKLMVATEPLASGVFNVIDTGLQDMLGWITSHQPEIIGFFRAIGNAAVTMGSFVGDSIGQVISVVGELAKGLAQAYSLSQHIYAGGQDLLGRHDQADEARKSGDDAVAAAQRLIDKGEALRAMSQQTGERVREMFDSMAQRAQRAAEFSRDLGENIRLLPDEKTVVLKDNSQAAIEAIDQTRYKLETMPDGEVRVVARTNEATTRMDAWRQQQNGQPVRLPVEPGLVEATQQVENWLAQMEASAVIPVKLQPQAPAGGWSSALGGAAAGGGAQVAPGGGVGGAGALPAAAGGAGAGGSFDSGGMARGIGWMPKMTVRPERVLNPNQTAMFEQLVMTLQQMKLGNTQVGPGRQRIEQLLAQINESSRETAQATERNANQQAGRGAAGGASGDQLGRAAGQAGSQALSALSRPASSIAEQAVKAVSGMQENEPGRPATVEQLQREGRGLLAVLTQGGIRVGDYTRKGGVSASKTMAPETAGYDSSGRMYSNVAQLLDRSFSDMKSEQEAQHRQVMQALDQIREKFTRGFLLPLMKEAVAEGFSMIRSTIFTSVGTQLGQAAGPPIAAAIQPAAGTGAQTPIVMPMNGPMLGAVGGYMGGGAAPPPPAPAVPPGGAGVIAFAAPETGMGSILGGEGPALYDEGGLWPSGTAGMNLSGSAERVLSPTQTVAFDAGELGGWNLPPSGEFASIMPGMTPISGDPGIGGADLLGVSQIPGLSGIADMLVKGIGSLIGVELQSRDALINVRDDFRKFRADFNGYTASGRLVSDTSGLTARHRGDVRSVADSRYGALQNIATSGLNFGINEIAAPIIESLAMAGINAGASVAAAGLSAIPGGAGRFVMPLVSTLISSGGSALVQTLAPTVKHFANMAVNMIVPGVFTEIDGAFPEFIKELFGGRLPNDIGEALNQLVGSEFGEDFIDHLQTTLLDWVNQIIGQVDVIFGGELNPEGFRTGLLGQVQSLANQLITGVLGFANNIFGEPSLANTPGLKYGAGSTTPTGGVQLARGGPEPDHRDFVHRLLDALGIDNDWWDKLWGRIEHMLGIDDTGWLTQILEKVANMLGIDVDFTGMGFFQVLEYSIRDLLGLNTDQDVGFFQAVLMKIADLLGLDIGEGSFLDQLFQAIRAFLGLDDEQGNFLQSVLAAIRSFITEALTGIADMLGIDTGQGSFFNQVLSAFWNILGLNSDGTTWLDKVFRGIMNFLGIGGGGDTLFGTIIDTVSGWLGLGSSNNRNNGRHSSGRGQTLGSSGGGAGGSFLDQAIDTLGNLASNFTGGLISFDEGGVATGTGYMPKDTIHPERVLSPHQTRSFDRLVSALEGGSPTFGGRTVTIHAPFYVEGGAGGAEEAHDHLLELMS